MNEPKDTKETTAVKGRGAKFPKGLQVDQPIELTFGVSMGNEKQKGNDLDSFVSMVNRHSTSIKKVTVLVGAYLHRHYVGESAAIKMHEQWVSDTADNLSRLKVPYEIVDWKEVVTTTEFYENLEFVKKLYATDEEFQTKVNLISKAHLNRADIETVKEYLLEECAFFKGRKGYFSYPIQKLNAACEYVIEKFNPDFHFKGYTLTPPKTNGASENMGIPQRTQYPTTFNNISRNSPPPVYSVPMQVPLISLDAPESYNPQYLFMCCSQMSLLMERHGIHGVKAQEGFFSRYLKQTQTFLSSTLNSVEADDIYDTQNPNATTNSY